MSLIRGNIKLVKDAFKATAGKTVIDVEREFEFFRELFRTQSDRIGRLEDRVLNLEMRKP